MSTSAAAARLDRYAEFVVRVCANVQPGQDVHVGALVEHAPVARAVAEQAYLAGARRVVVEYADLHVRRSAIAHAPADALGTHYPHELERMRWWREHGIAWISLTGNPDPRIYDGLDPTRIAALPSKALAAEVPALIHDVAWTAVAAPNAGWAEQVFGEPDVERLWAAVAIATRLDSADPVEAWREHLARLDARKRALDGLGLDAVRFRGPGTDLTVGLIPGTTWLGGSAVTPGGVRFLPNAPTEEVFTSPDWRRIEGTVSITEPLILASSPVEGLRLRFEGGRIVQVSADRGAALVEAQLDGDERARYLGEVALVDGSSRVRQAGVTFHDTLFDENVGCHIAFGTAYTEALAGADELDLAGLLGRGLNVATVHTDVTIGGREVSVDGLLADGTEIPLIRDDLFAAPLG
jgi:aminopeptidase